jgi:hypothetical protein
LQAVHEILDEENRFERAPHELGYLLEVKEATYPEKITETHTPLVLLDYETDLQSYDKKLCPSLDGRFS